jgi:hypothetical protein
MWRPLAMNKRGTPQPLRATQMMDWKAVRQLLAE